MDLIRDKRPVSIKHLEMLPDALRVLKKAIDTVPVDDSSFFKHQIAIFLGTIGCGFGGQAYTGFDKGLNVIPDDAVIILDDFTSITFGEIKRVAAQHKRLQKILEENGSELKER